ncbi:MAG: HEAT repeat domain-containing protein [Phycisphaerae bacterium]|nr:HEAT repeat domain-containing protein [Phycisphaerae bacterium]
MADKTNIDSFLDQVPPLNKSGKVVGPAWEKMEPILKGILAQGADAITGLIDRLNEVDDGRDYPARYLLHGLAVYLGRSDQGKSRGVYQRALLAALASDWPESVREFLVRQIQVAGGAEAVPELARSLGSQKLRGPAIAALVAIGGTEAVGVLRKALENGGASDDRLALVQALGSFGDAGAAPALRSAAAGDDEPVADLALWALAEMGDAGAVGLAIKAAEATGSRRTRATDACLLLAERLAAAGKKEPAGRLYRHLRQSRTDPKENYVREAAERGLAAIG